MWLMFGLLALSDNLFDHSKSRSPETQKLGCFAASDSLSCGRCAQYKNGFPKTLYSRSQPGPPPVHSFFYYGLLYSCLKKHLRL